LSKQINSALGKKNNINELNVRGHDGIKVHLSATIFLCLLLCRQPVFLMAFSVLATVISDGLSAYWNGIYNAFRTSQRDPKALGGMELTIDG